MSDWEDAPSDDGWEDSKNELTAKEYWDKAPNWVKAVPGAGEAVISMVAGVPSQIAGGLYGLGTLMSGQGLEKAAKAVEDTQRSNFGFGEYEPRTDLGKKYSENLQKAFAYPGEKMGDVGAYIGNKLGNEELGRFSAKLPTDIAMNFLPVHSVFKTPGLAAKGISKVGEKLKGKDTFESLDKNLDTLSKNKSGWEDAPEPQQMELPLENSPQHIAEMQARTGAQRDLFAPVNQELNVADTGSRVPNSLELERQRRAGLTNELSQTELFDQPEMGRVANPYEAKLGDWRVDENGIPIKADLSMEAANLEQPLQRNLWGDELEHTRNPVGQEATLFDQNGLQEGVPLTQAIDSMPWAQRRGAIKRELTGEVPVTGELQAAIAEANRRHMGSDNPRFDSQRGALNIEALKEGYDKLKELANGITLAYHGGVPHEGEAHIVAYKNGSQVGELQLGNTAGVREPTINDSLKAHWVKSDLYKQGLAKQMYEFAVEQGHDIQAAGIQTAAGKAMWDSFRREGFATGNTISVPKGQKGAVDFETLTSVVKKMSDRFNKSVEDLHTVNVNRIATKTKDDYAREIPGMKSVVEGIHVKPVPASEIIPKILAEGKDGPSLIRSLQQGLELTSEKTRSGLMRYTADWLNWVDKKTEYGYKTTVKPTQEAIAKLKDDMIPLAKILSKEMFNGARFTEEQLRSLGLNPKVLEAYNKLRENLDNIANLYDEGRARLGLPPLKRGEAYLASTRSGNYHVVVNGVTKSGETYPAWHMQFESAREAYKAIDWFKENMKDNPNLDIKGLDKYKSTQWGGAENLYRGSNAATSVPKDILGAYHEIAKLIDPESDAAVAIAEAIRQANEKAGYNVGTTKNRFMEKSNIRGFEGDMPWLSERENATRLLNAQLSTIKEGMRWTYMQEALANIKDVMADPKILEQQPNNMAMVKEVMNNQLGLTKSIFKDAEDWMMHNGFGMSRAGLRKATESLKGMTYLQQLGMSPGYMLGTSLSALNSVGMALRERGLGALSPTVIAKTMIDGLGGLVYDLSHEFGQGHLQPPLTGLGKKALQYAEDNGIVTKTLFSAGHEVPNVGRVPGVVEKLYRGTMSLPEKTSRLLPFMAFVHHLNEMGIYSDNLSLFKRAEELTNASQVNFRASERPTLVSKLGTLGSLGYVYKAPIFNYFHQVSTFARDMVNGSTPQIKARGAMALFGLLGMTTYLGGALATPMVSEMDGAWNLIKDAWAKFSPHNYKLVSGLGLKGSIISKMDESSAYGAVSSATGAQMSSRFTPNMIDVEHPFSGVAPVATELNEQTSLLKLLHDPSKRHLLEAAYVNGNPVTKGMMETMFPEFKSIKTSQGQGYINPSQVGGAGRLSTDVVRTPEQETYRKFGLRELGEARGKDLRAINNAEQKRIDTAVEGNLDRMFTAMVDKNPMLVNRYAKAALDLNPDGNMLSSQLEKKVIEYATTPEQRDAMKADAIRTLLKMKRLRDAAH